MQNISVYMNKQASNSNNDWKNQINTALFRSNIDYQTPTTINDLHTCLDQDIENKTEAVMSIGGDGTAHTIIQKLAGTDVGLLVIPGGTANDLATGLGSSSNIKRITQTIRQNVKKKIDLISINGTFMATNGGLGFAAEVAEEVNNLRKEYPGFKSFMKVSGKNIYSLFIAKKILSKTIRSYKFRIQSEEYSDVIESPLILINNQPVLAGSFEVAPLTKHQDGTFNITIFTHKNRFDLISAIIKIFNGEIPKNDPFFKTFESSEVNIELLQDEKLTFFGDGELFAESNKWNIKCHPNLLNVYSPKDQKDLVNICTQVSIL